MTQRNLRGKELEIYKQSLKLTDVQREIIIGTLLGDASMSLRNGLPCYSIKFEQSEEHADYIYHLYEIFEPFTGTPPAHRWIDQTRVVKKNQGSFLRAIWFRTYRHDSLIFYWNLFYADGRKSLPKNIAKFITPRVLAYWFMDDGNQTSDHQSYNINTQGFYKHESEKLCKILKEKFNITASINKDKNSWRISIYRESAETFRTLIEPYVLSCFNYRLKLKIT